MLPQLNNFFATLLPQVNRTAGPVAQAEAGGGDRGGVMEMLKGLIAGGQQQPQQGGMTPDMWAKLLEPENVDVVGQANRVSNLAGGTGGNPWGSGFFKPMDQAFQDTGVRDQGLPGWANPASPQNRGETVGLPTPWASSFMGNSGDDLGADGQVIGRSAADRYGSGSSVFATPQAPTGQRLQQNDALFAQLASLVPAGPKPKQPFSFGTTPPRF